MEGNLLGSEVVLDTLLKTKLYIPPAPSELVSRPRLLERLDAGLRRKLTLISAPAGFGKTTLLSEWISQSPVRAAWVSLDEGDNDPVRFLTYFIAALQTIEPDFGQTALAVLQASHAQPPPVEGILTSLINDLIDLPEPVILILDDYHVIEAQIIDEALTFLIDHLRWPAAPGRQQPGMHLLIAGRADPALPLSRLRANSQMNELRADDLRFSTAEAASFLNVVTDLDFAPDDVIALESRTEGWIAGLQLAVLSMQGRQDIHAFVEAFTGSHHYIVDYLMDEVLSQRPDGTQDFLLKTAILDRMCASLCDAVLTPGLGEARSKVDKRFPTFSQTTLETLEAANFFVVPLDDERCWYRYHHLFADFLRARLQQANAEQIPELHRRAATWYKHQGFMAEAVSHFLKAEAFEQAADLVEQVARDILRRGEHGMIRGWIDALPQALVCSRPRLCLVHVWALTYIRDTAGIESRLQDVEQALNQANASELTKTEIDHLRGEVAAYQATLMFWRNENLDDAMELCQQALGKLPKHDLHLRGQITLILGILYRDNHDLAAANRLLNEAYTLNRETDNIIWALEAQVIRAGVLQAQGKLRQAARSYRQALELATTKNDQLLPTACYGLVGLGKVHREWNKLDEATHYLEQALDLGRQARFDHVVFDGTITLALVLQGQGQLDAANAMLERAEQQAQTWNRARPLERLAVFKARLCLAQGRLEEADYWVQESGVSRDDSLGGRFEMAYSMLARLLIAQEKPDEALTLLDRLHDMTSSARSFGSLIEILILQALAHQARGDIAQTVPLLERALVLAKPEGYIRLFVDEGQPIVKLLQLALARKITPTYTSRLLTACKIDQVSSIAQSQVQPLAEPLTERELEVLNLIAAGLSNQAIAETLYITVGTVKRHTVNIYGKLGVNSRTQASVKARELKLIK